MGAVAAGRPSGHLLAHWLVELRLISSPRAAFSLGTGETWAAGQFVDERWCTDRANAGDQVRPVAPFWSCTLIG